MDLLLVAAKRDEINDYAQLARDAQAQAAVVDIDAFTIQNLFEFSRGLPPDQTVALINVGASLSTLNIVSARRQRLHPRDRQRRQLHHRADPEAARRAASSRPRLTSAGRARAPARVPQQVAQVIESVIDSIAGEIQRSARLLHGHQRRGRDRAHLPHGRHREPARACRRPSSAARACRSKSGRRSRRSPSMPRTSNRSCSRRARAQLVRRARARACARKGRSARDSRQPAAAEARGRAHRRGQPAVARSSCSAAGRGRDRRARSCSTRSSTTSSSSQKRKNAELTRPDRPDQKGAWPTTPRSRRSSRCCALAKTPSPSCRRAHRADRHAARARAHADPGRGPERRPRSLGAAAPRQPARGLQP